MHKQRNTNNTLTKKLISAKYQIYKKNIKKQEKILCLSLGQGLWEALVYSSKPANLERNHKIGLKSMCKKATLLIQKTFETEL